MAVNPARRGEAYPVALDPTRGGEIRKTRPCAVVSPDELNDHPQTVLAASRTTAGHPYPFRIARRFQRRDGFVILDRLRTVLTTLQEIVALSARCASERIALT